MHRTKISVIRIKVMASTSPTINVNVDETNQKKSFIEKLKGSDVGMRFQEVIRVHFALTRHPIQGTIWEDIKCKILEKSFHICEQANGGHKSGKDNRVDNFNMSDKTAKIDKNDDILNISSYRLTNVCNAKKTGDVNEIVLEIEERDKSFDFFSILVKNDNNNSTTYEWYVVPKDYYIFKIVPNDLREKVGKKGKNKDEIVGWEWEHGDITFSMSSQLWYKFDINLIQQFRIHSVELNHNSPIVDYSTLFNLMNDNGLI